MMFHVRGKLYYSWAWAASVRRLTRPSSLPRKTFFFFKFWRFKMWMRSSPVVRESDWDLALWLERLTANAKVTTVLRFESSVLRHSGIWGEVDKAVLNKVHKKGVGHSSPLLISIENHDRKKTAPTIITMYTVKKSSWYPLQTIHITNVDEKAWSFIINHSMLSGLLLTPLTLYLTNISESSQSRSVHMAQPEKGKNILTKIHKRSRINLIKK